MAIRSTTRQEGQGSRDAQIARASTVSIAVNVVLAAFKAVVGLATGSMAVVVDGVNSLSDAVSSIITLVGLKLSMRPADRKHPYGYGRIEYFTAVIVASIVLAAGASSFVESARHVVAPEPASYSAPALVVIVAAILTKVVLGRYVSTVGKRVHSDSLVASGADASFDAVVTFSTLVSAGVSLVWGVSIDGVLGMVISAVIVKSGLEMLSAPLDQMLGARVDPELSHGIEKIVSAVPGVLGVYDLVLHNYGPEHMIGSVHISVDDTTTAERIDHMTHRIQHEVLATYGVFLTVGIYAHATGDDEVARMLEDVRTRAMTREHVSQVHGLYADEDVRVLTFDILVDFDCDDPFALRDGLVAEIAGVYPGWRINVTIDRDYSD